MINFVLVFIGGFSFGIGLASSIYARKFRHLHRQFVRLGDELDDANRGFDIRWEADMRAIKRWQAAHPGNDHVWPDHADLVVWLMGENKTMH